LFCEGHAWIPIYDKSDLPGFYLAIGTSGNQYKNAPEVGKMMAELITQFLSTKSAQLT